MNKLKINYLAIPLITIVTAFTGSFITSLGLGWYETIQRPTWTPSGEIISAVWTILFVLATISALLFWNAKISDDRRHLICGLFVVNAFANITWSLLFFGNHLIGTAMLEAGFLGLETAGIILALWKISKSASILMIPYALWVFFATFLTYSIYVLN